MGGTLPAATYTPAGAHFQGSEHLVTNEGPLFTVTMGDPDGAYSTLRYDSQTGSVTLESDLSGQLCLRYAQIGRTLYVASHDLLLAPYVPFSVDERSLTNLRKVGWSLGGHSLIQGITTCPAGSRVTIRPNGTVETSHSSLPTTHSAHDAILGYLSDRLPSGLVTVELSAGFDSRAALAATLACKEVSDIRAFSEGPADSQDVMVAAEICKRYGIAFTHRTTYHRSFEEVLNDWSHAAALNNGHIEVNILASRGKSIPTVCGDGGEIYRGYYYPYRPFERLRSPVSIDPHQVLKKKMGGGERLNTVLAHLSKLTEGPRAVLDLFYATERFGVWNQKLAREGSQRVSPFYARKAFHAVGNGRDCLLHCELIEKYLPKTMEIPINDEAAPSAYAGGKVKQAMLEARILAAKVARRVYKPKNLQTDRADRMNAVLQNLPEGFLYGQAGGWADYGAQRFLQLYREAADDFSPVSHFLSLAPEASANPPHSQFNKG